MSKKQQKTLKKSSKMSKNLNKIRKIPKNIHFPQKILNFIRLWPTFPMWPPQLILINKIPWCWVLGVGGLGVGGMVVGWLCWVVCGGDGLWVVVLGDGDGWLMVGSG